MNRPAVGRNDPCPCGGGKKYKKCHGRESEPSRSTRFDVARANALKAVDRDLGQRLLRYVETEYDEQWLRKAVANYLDAHDTQLSDADVALAIPWVLFSMPVSPNGTSTLAKKWARKHAKDLSPDTRLLLKAYANSWLSIWEVAEVERGVGVALVDQLTREQRFVFDVASSETLEPLDTILGFVLDCDGVSFYGGVHGQPLSPREAALVVHQARRICRVRTRPVSVELLRDIDTQIDIISLWKHVIDIVLAQPVPTLTNTDGDAFVVTTDDFELLGDRDDVAKSIESIDGVQEPQREGGELVFAVVKPGNAQHSSWDNTVIGKINVTARRLRIETNSIRRANELRAHVEKLLAEAVRFRLRTEGNTRQMLESARASASSAERSRDDQQSPDEIAAIREFRQRYMRTWIDDSIPALGGLTPREAAKAPRSRGALETLLKELDHHEARLPAEERIDLSWLRAELGMKGD